jgi:hypothetical protein
MRVVPLVALTAVLAGCATEAAREHSRMGAAITAAQDDRQACRARISQSAEWQDLSPYLPPLDGSEPSMTQRLNNDVPTADQAATLVRLFDGYTQPCQARDVARLQAAHPAMAAAVSEIQAVRNQAYAKLAGRQMTWGAYANVSATLMAEGRSQLAKVDQQIDGELQTRHAQELQRRQQASANALAAGAQLLLLGNQQRALDQNQQMINAANRPRSTNCTVIGGFLNCTTF